MKVKMCVNNLDLFSEENDHKLIKEIVRCETLKKGDYELEESHCLGLCFLCQQNPTAVINNKIFHVKKSH